MKKAKGEEFTPMLQDEINNNGWHETSRVGAINAWVEDHVIEHLRITIAGSFSVHCASWQQRVLIIFSLNLTLL
jgi:hypothetical protein